MKKLIPSVLLALFSCATVVTAGDNTLSKSENADGWTLLFNGKDLSGWSMDVPALDKKPEGKKPFVARNGMLVSLGSPGGHLLTDEKFAERAQKFFLYKDTTGKCHTHEELMAVVGETQKDKHGKVILPYTPHVEGQHGYVKEATDRGYTVLVMDGPLAAHVVSKLEQTHSDVQFKRVDADIADKLIEKDEELSSALDEKQEETLKPILEGAFPGEAYKVKFAPMSPTSAPLVITQSEFMRRMKEQQAVGGGGFQMFGDLPGKYEVTINSNHPLATKILGEKDDDKRNAIAKEAADLARLSQGILEGEELSAFISRGFKNLQS